MSDLTNLARIRAGIERSRRPRTVWAALAAGGGRIVGTADGTAHVLAIVGPPRTSNSSAG